MPRRPSASSGPVSPAVTIVLAVYDPPVEALVEQLRAIAGQTSFDWECVVVNDASTDPNIAPLLDEWVGLGAKWRVIHRSDNGRIAAATNDGLDAAVGRFVTICDHDDLIAHDAVAAIVEHFAEHPDHDIVYTDEQTIDPDGNVIAEYAKPDYLPRRHLAHHYLAHLVAARRSAIGDLRVRRSFEPSQDYDFWLRVIENSTRTGGVLGDNVGHIAQMLYSWRAIAGSSALDAAEKPEMCDAVRRCVQAALDRRGIPRRAVTVHHEGRPTTSVLLEPVDDVAPSVAIVRFAPDTPTAELNAAALACDADVVSFVPAGSDVDAVWAAPLAYEAIQPGAGVVGPKIATSNGELHSIGRVVLPTLADPFSGEPADTSGPWGSFFVVREVSAVAPAGLTISRAAFEQADGFATDVSLDVAAAELCIECNAAGHNTLVHPGVTLVHDVVGDAGFLAIDPSGFARARNRHDDRWTEGLDSAGRKRVEWSAPNVYEWLHAVLAAGRVDLVTTDVFDTVVTRAVATPSDLFVALAERLDLPAHVTPAMFAEGRRTAERRARQDRVDMRRREMVAADPTVAEEHIVHDPMIAAPEVTLEEIWARVPDAWGDSVAMMAAELAIEAEALRPIPATIEAFGWARRAGVPVVLVSDVYLTGAQLSSLLAAAGVDMSLVDAVVTSADHGVGKAHGLLGATIASRSVSPDRVAHIGDNEIADIDTAVRLGALAVHVDIPRSQRYVELPPRPLAAWSGATGTDLGITAAVRSVLVDAGRFGSDPAFQYGAAVIGPVLAGFSRWVGETTESLGASNVHCMLREGATIAELLAVTSPTGPTAIPIHVSRWVTMRAAVIDATPDELYAALARRADMTVEHVVAAFGCDADRVRELLGGESIDPRQLPGACVAFSEDEMIRTQIIAHAADLRARVLTYLRPRLVVTDDAPLVVADVGWGGTIQEGLTRILRSDDIETEVIGLYLALSAAGEDRLVRGARMLSYLPNATDDAAAAMHSRTVAHHADTIERIMTPAMGTLIDIDAHGEPVCRDVNHDPLTPTLRAAQRALRLVVDRLAVASTGPGGLADDHWFAPPLRSAFAQIVADTVTSPSRPLAEALGSWPHDDVAGTMHRSIAGADLAEIVRFSNIRDVGELDPSGRKWVAGLAAALNPTLSAQISAAGAGVATDDLAPAGENGVARLVTFEANSDLPAVFTTRAGTVLPSGWSVFRVTEDVRSLRSLRFEASPGAVLVDIADFSIRLTTNRFLDRALRRVALTDPDVFVVDGRRIDGRRFVHRQGGHLVVDIAPDLAPHVRAVEMVVAFRCWRLDDDYRLTESATTERVVETTHRLGRAVRRRF